jgi:spermidine/putrescine transport system permease protein
MPFMILPLYSILEKIDYSFLEASADLGATPRQTFRNVVVPLSYPGIITGFFLVFVPAFGEFVIPLLVGGNKDMYAGGLITHYFLMARNSSMGGAFTCLSSIVLLMVSVMISWLLRRIVGVKQRLES